MSDLKAEVADAVMRGGSLVRDKLLAEIEDLKQQLSNSTPNAAIRELIDYFTKYYIKDEYENSDVRAGISYVISDLNKLLTNKEEG